MGFLDQAAAKMGDATKAAQDRVAAQQARTAADAQPEAPAPAAPTV
jgi:hypothetical protein